MKKRLLLALFSILLFGLTESQAQELHCHKASRKDDKSDKKEEKVRKKMFHDRPWKASKKNFKSFKKECKSEGKEHKHRVINNEVH